MAVINRRDAMKLGAASGALAMFGPGLVLESLAAAPELLDGPIRFWLRTRSGRVRVNPTYSAASDPDRVDVSLHLPPNCGPVMALAIELWFGETLVKVVPLNFADKLGPVPVEGGMHIEGFFIPSVVSDAP